LLGGIHQYKYAQNSTGWVDPLGLTPKGPNCPCPEGTIDSSKIHFMQSNAKNTTGEYTVLGNAQGLQDGSLRPDVLKVRVWKDEAGKVWTLDHRRLAAFKLAKQRCIPADMLDNPDPKEIARKMTTKNGGTSMQLKLGNGERMKVG